MNKITFFATLALLAPSTPALAFQSGVEDIVGRAKVGKTLPASMVTTLMSESERWCYREANGGCDWSDIYLAVTDGAIEFEVGNAWSEEIDIAMTDHAQLEGNLVCETGWDWVPSVRATRRADGSSIGGRELKTIKDEIYAARTSSVIDCFDYIYESADAATDTIVLRQRQHTDGVYQPVNDAVVTVHFDPQRAAALTWNWSTE